LHSNSSNTKMRTTIFLLLCILLSLNSFAQDFDRVKMDSLFSILDSNNKAMGSVSVFKNGLEVYQKSIGYADVEKNLKANTSTKYRIGSISKTFTAAIVMQLVEEGKLTLDTRLSDFYREIPNAGKITLEQLLRHRSGLFNFTNASSYFTWMENPKTQEELIRIFIENGIVFEPDEKFEYSNTNYVLLSFIIEKTDKKPYAEVLEERITTPLQLADTYLGGKIGAKTNEAKSYILNTDWTLATETDMSIPLGAGAIVSTPSDLNKFFNALFNYHVITKESLLQMTRMVDGYGLGLFQIPFYERKAFGHNGGIDGFQSNASFFQDDQVSLAYLTNGAAMSMNDILIGVLSIYFGKDYELPSFAPAMVVNSEDLDQYLGIYSSTAIPLKITISKQGSQLMAQATGQPAFPLEAFEVNKFRFDQAGIKMEFIPDDKKLILNQGGGRFEFLMENE
jgi:D-alanyl-D-alanine carboxypeptidase